MTPSCNKLWRIAALALLIGMAGCSESSPFRLGGLRRGDRAEGPPKPAPALFIPDPPVAVRTDRDDNVKPAAFLTQPGNPKPQTEPGITLVEQPLRAIYDRAAKTCATLEAYSFRLKSREVVHGKKHAEELIQIRVRREPFSLHFQWLSDKTKGREVIYVHGKYKNEMQILLAPNDRFAAFGRRQSIAPNDPMVRAESRYPITDSGFASLVERFGRLIVSVEKGDPRDGSVKYLGRVTRPEFQGQLDAVHQVIPPNGDPLFPRGGNRWWFFDPASGLPVLIIAHDSSGEVEYYCHDQIQSPINLSENDFNPDRLWRK
ncbi:MAG: DUF1571 domain-containing protein [Planctomycetes bacterium]|nr:DUF1571 domain-containing protein [Planctomycetota bacterium]